MNKYLEKIAIDINMSKDPVTGTFSQTHSMIPVAERIPGAAAKPGIFSRIASRVGKMGTFGKIGLGVAGGIAATKMLGNNNSNNSNPN